MSDTTGLVTAIVQLATATVTLGAAIATLRGKR